jgi:hypothetical protein
VSSRLTKSPLQNFAYRQQTTDTSTSFFRVFEGKVIIISESTQKKELNPSLILFAASFASLFFELLIIRWLTCDFIAFGVFKTFPLVTCFVGLGTGVAKGNSNKYFALVTQALLITVAVSLFTSFKGYGGVAFPSLTLYQWNNLNPHDLQLLSLQVFQMTLLIVLLLMGPFAVMFCIGSLIGETFNKLPPLKAYCVDIMGAITGSITFALLSFFCVSPNIEVIIFAIIIAALLVATKRSLAVGIPVLIASCVVALLPWFNDPVNTVWSPYYRIDVAKIPLAGYLNKTGKFEDLGILVSTNRGFSQAFTPNFDVELSEAGMKEEAARKIQSFLKVRKHYYALPYIFKEAPKDVLILGAGSGSDVAEACKRGATWIDAVEIDPGTLDLAKKHNPYFNNPAVHYHLDDGRRYIAKNDKKYDLIILACLDSRALSGTGSSLRTDCYIHTRESYADCAKLLKPDGVMALSFGASVTGNSEWLRNRIYKTLESVMGYPPIVMSDEKAETKWPAYFFATGSPIKDALVQAPVNPDSFTKLDVPPNPEGLILTDDWPFLYIRDKVIDLPYLVVLFLVVAITVYVARELIFSKKSGSDLQLFFLGSAFILVELQAISRLSLLYGATWVTASIVINGVLVMILAANWVIIKSKNPFNQNILYALLFASLAGSYLLPVNAIRTGMASMDTVAAALITVVTLLPILMAGLIFATAFKIVQQPSRSFAFNLLGSVLGGLLEYLSTYMGINNLVLVSILLYVFSYVSARQASKQG